MNTQLLQRKCACGGSAGPDGACEGCCAGRLGVQRRRAAPTESAGVPRIVYEVLRSSGEPLDGETRGYMEPRVGHDFSRVSVFSNRPQNASEALAVGPAHDQYEQEADASAVRVASATNTPTGRRVDFADVRVHTGPSADASAAALGAQAYTVGNHIVFGTGRYMPRTGEGKKLLAHELTHVLQQTGPAQGRLQRAPEKEDKPKDEKKPATKIVGCGKDQPKIEDAIKEAEALANRAVYVFERDYPLSHEVSAMQTHFGKKLANEQKSKIVERYKHVLSSLGNKTYTCAQAGSKTKEGDERVDPCAKASCPGSNIVLLPDFGKETCPAGPVMLHEAIHNAGACDDINKGQTAYPPDRSEDNAYSYEYFAAAVLAGPTAPTKLKERDPKAPKAKI